MLRDLVLGLRRRHQTYMHVNLEQVSSHWEGAANIFYPVRAWSLSASIRGFLAMPRYIMLRPTERYIAWPFHGSGLQN